MLNPGQYEHIALDRREGGVVLATLNRPDKLNAVNGVLHGELARLPQDFDADPDAKVLVITGAGRSFCAGADFSPSGSSDRIVTHDEARQIVDNQLNCGKPVISAVNGYAIGLGATFALLADVVYAGRSASFSDTHVLMGVGAGDGGQLMWPLLMGVSRAKYFLMTGERLTAEEAERLGLVNFVVDDDAVLDEALALAARLASGPSLAISASKMAINAYMKFVSSIVMPLSLALESNTMNSADYHEAVAAFREKRPPIYSGH